MNLDFQEIIFGQKTRLPQNRLINFPILILLLSWS
ncbi:hypothetical protein Pint_14245 [Pistacia integerrima]|uniref:Uncharacterized protein n=1 Tax=Pistacia integerrima TaxID=434235 RepID=A0ACC0Y7K7_9ROSI|nr:hypothetical protein Pint_14245 [Pistacia integerrima]